MNTQTAPNKTEVRKAIREMRQALRCAEASVAKGDMEGAAHYLHYLVAPVAATTARNIADSRGVTLPSIGEVMHRAHRRS